MTAKPEAWEEAVQKAAASLRQELGDNLHACCLYGSAVRGNVVEGISDLNLLIILKVSHGAAHDAIARAIGADARIDPFVLGLAGFPRSVRAFAAKFASIKLNYRVLYGVDPLANIEIEPQLERFLCEQALRNLRLRLAFAYVTRARRQNYPSFILHSITPIFLRLSEIVRLSGTEVPKAFEPRIALFEQQFAINGAILRDLLALRKSPESFSINDETHWHEGLFAVLDAAVGWIEENWPSSAPQI